jgi:hypothetical protein
MHDLLMVVSIPVAAVYGAAEGAQFGSRWGAGGGIAGGVAGFVGGAAAALGFWFLPALILTPLEMLCRWWRPYPPRCVNAVCGPDSFKPETTPQPLRDGYPWLSGVTLAGFVMGWVVVLGHWLSERKD